MSAMANPYSIQIHCDGAMDRNTAQTGGNGFVIEFPDSIGADPITGVLRNDGQGIHRLEMISLIEAMEALLVFAKRNPHKAKKAVGVELYTDRIRVTDQELTDPYKIREWRRNGWKNYEGKEIKDRDLLDRIDKLRVKLSRTTGGRVSISYEREKRNRKADKLSKLGKKEGLISRKIRSKKNRRVIRRLFEGTEVNYKSLIEGAEIRGRVYAWEPIGSQCEICFEIVDGDLIGRVLKVYVGVKEKESIHWGHFYEFDVQKIYTHHILIEGLREINIENK